MRIKRIKGTSVKLPLGVKEGVNVDLHEELVTHPGSVHDHTHCFRDHIRIHQDPELLDIKISKI